jgi:hypothetical protein
MKMELYEAIKLTRLIRKYGDLRALWAKSESNESAEIWSESECVFDEIKKLIG